VDYVADPTPLISDSPPDESDDDEYEETVADPVPSRPTTPMPSTSQLPTPRATDAPSPETKPRLRSQVKKKTTTPALQLHLLADWKRQESKLSRFKLSNGCPFDLYFTTTIDSRTVLISAEGHQQLSLQFPNDALLTQKFVVRANSSVNTPALNEAKGFYLLIQSDGLGFGDGAITVSEAGSPPPVASPLPH